MDVSNRSDCSIVGPQRIHISLLYALPLQQRIVAKQEHIGFSEIDPLVVPSSLLGRRFGGRLTLKGGDQAHTTMQDGLYNGKQLRFQVHAAFCMIPCTLIGRSDLGNETSFMVGADFGPVVHSNANTFLGSIDHDQSIVQFHAGGY